MGLVFWTTGAYLGRGSEDHATVRPFNGNRSTDHLRMKLDGQRLRGIGKARIVGVFLCIGCALPERARPKH